MKSGERTDKADGHIQDGPKILTGSKVSPPTHPKTNKFCDDSRVLIPKVPAYRTGTIRYRSIYALACRPGALPAAALAFPRGQPGSRASTTRDLATTAGRGRHCSLGPVAALVLIWRGRSEIAA